VKNPEINLSDLVILVADPNSYIRRLIFGMLRGFGANKLLEVDGATSLVEALTNQKIDILLCDARFPPSGGLALTKNIRRDIHNENRTMPILIMCSDGREATVKRARDAGANMVIAKPISAKGLYDRLAWIAFSPRKFIDTATYFGPDRRFKIEGYPNGVGRRKGDNVLDVADEVGPALAQDDIDSLFSATRTGQS
jgi:two-component system chemotaxis response regulator CheY